MDTTKDISLCKNLKIRVSIVNKIDKSKDSAIRKTVGKNYDKE